MAREGAHWAMPWWHTSWEKIRQVVIMICSEQTSSEFFCCRRPLAPILQGHLHQYLRCVSIEFQADHGKGGSALIHAIMACQLRKNTASRHYNLQWTNIVWILLLPHPLVPTLQGHPHQYLRWVSIQFQADHGKRGGALGNATMAWQLRKNTASRHYDLQWTNIV